MPLKEIKTTEGFSIFIVTENVNALIEQRSNKTVIHMNGSQIALDMPVAEVKQQLFGGRPKSAVGSAR